MKKLILALLICLCSQVLAADANDPNILSSVTVYTMPKLPKGATVVNNVFSWTPTHTQKGIYYVPRIATKTVKYADGTTTVLTTGGMYKITVKDFPQSIVFLKTLISWMTKEKQTLTFTANFQAYDPDVNEPDVYDANFSK